jgi:multimeric flavodoxin WrbA
MAAADGIILGSPVYVASITPELLALIDRSGRVGGANGHLFKRKVGAAIIAVRRRGALHALDSINHFMHISQMILPGAMGWNVGVGRDAGDVEKDIEGITTMQSLGQNIAWLLKKINE